MSKPAFFYSLKALFFLILVFSISSCRVVRQGEFGVKRKLGKYNDGVYTSGLRVFNPFTSKIITISSQTENIEVSINIPSREGLTIQSEVSILYKVRGKDAPNLLRNVGLDYEETIILPVFRSAVADVTSKYYAKDMHSGNRAEIEVAIRELMMKTLDEKGIIVESVLLKSIMLPKNLTKAIEDKLEAEQQAQRMEFILAQERQEAERKRIAATATRDANKIIAEGLTQEILQFKALEAWLQLSQSPNSKVIITNGTVPMMLNPAEDGAVGAINK
jgi:prohibitin 1